MNAIEEAAFLDAAYLKAREAGADVEDARMEAEAELTSYYKTELKALRTKYKEQQETIDRLCADYDEFHTKYEALCSEHVELQHRYERDKRDWKQLHDDTLDRHDAELKALHMKYEALRTACQALLNDCSEDPDLRTDIQNLIK